MIQQVMITRPSFCLGEVVQGFLNVIPIDAPILRISMALVCECQIEICESIFDGESTNYYYFPYSMELLHTQPMNVYASQSPGGAVFSSPASIPFAIPLPVSGLPSSLRSCPGEDKHPFGVKYYLKTYVFNPMGQVLNKIHTEVKVFNCFGFVNPEKPMLLAGEKQSMSMILCCFSKNKLYFYCNVDKTMYCPGEQMKLTYWIKTDKPGSLPLLKHVETSMVLRAISAAPPGVRLHKSSFSQPTTQTFESIIGSQITQAPEIGRAYHNVFAIPFDCGPAPFGTAPLTWSYQFCITLKLNRSFDNEVKIVIPIALNGKNAEQLAQTAYPLQYASAPAGAIEAQQFYITCAAQNAATTATAVPVASVFQPSVSVGGAKCHPEANDHATGGANVSYVSVPIVE